MLGREPAELSYERCTEQTFRLCGRRRRWDVQRTALKQVYYQGWNRSPAQVGCMRQVLGPGALGWPRGMGWRVRQEGGSGWGTHVNPWLIHINVRQKPLQYCKVISLQLIKINGGKKRRQIKKDQDNYIQDITGFNKELIKISLLLKGQRGK